MHIFTCTKDEQLFTHETRTLTYTKYEHRIRAICMELLCRVGAGRCVDKKISESALTVRYERCAGLGTQNNQKNISNIREG